MSQVKLEGKVAIVTGAGQGIGKAIALTLAREGADVIVNDLYPDNAEKVTSEIKSLGRQALALKADVSKIYEVNELVEKAIDKFEHIDILVNNAGTATYTPSLEVTEAEWDLVLGIDLKGLFFCCQAVARQMSRQNGGKIINIASIVGHVPQSNQAAYVSAKAGVIQLTRVLSKEWVKYNIQVNSVSPGYTETALAQKNVEGKPDLLRKYLKGIPLGRPGKVQDIAEAVLFLASVDITGQDLSVDGGTTALLLPFD